MNTHPHPFSYKTNSSHSITFPNWLKFSSRSQSFLMALRPCSVQYSAHLKLPFCHMHSRKIKNYGEIRFFFFFPKQCLRFSYTSVSSTGAQLNTVHGFELLKHDCKPILSMLLIGYIYQVSPTSVLCLLC